MHVELLDYTSGKAQVLATIRVEGETIVIDNPVPNALLDEIEAARQRFATPTLFLKSLPRLFSGSYLRAKLYRDEKTVEQVLKFNPNHDPKDGKFTTGRGIKAPPKNVLGSMGQPDGGFTYSPTTGRQPHIGFALSVHPEREQVVDATDANVVALSKYAAKNWDLLKQKGNYIGGWHHPVNGKVYLDVSTVVKTEAAARQLALNANQIAYFDLVKGESIKIGKRTD